MAALLAELRSVPSLRVLDLSANPVTTKEGSARGGGSGVGRGLGRAGASSTSSSSSSSAADTEALDAARALSVEGLEALQLLLAVPGSALEVLRLAGCQLCGTIEPGAEHKSGGAMVGARYDPQGVAAIATALKGRRCPLRQVVMSGNNIRGAEASALMAAVGEHVQELARTDPALKDVVPLILDLDGDGGSGGAHDLGA